jgi:hypothetical protein
MGVREESRFKGFYEWKDRLKARFSFTVHITVMHFTL